VLDDKIECNRSVYTLTESLARALFTVSLELGEGELRHLGELVEHLPGKYLPRDRYLDGGQYAVFGSNSIMGSHSEYLYKGPFTVMARIGSNCGTLMWSEKSAWVNNNASVLRARPGIDPWLMHRVLETIDMNQHRAGSGQPFIRIDSLLSTVVTVPRSSAQPLLGEKLQALAQRGDSASIESRILGALRDALLPKLLSGELRVHDAESVVEVGA
jgi:type I restriction enzyme S subunit